jgi:hypothetical protein
MSNVHHLKRLQLLSQLAGSAYTGTVIRSVVVPDAAKPRLGGIIRRQEQWVDPASRQVVGRASL